MTPTARTHAWILVTLAVFGSQPAASQGDDICFPAEFFTKNTISFPFELDSIINNQWFSLSAQREHVESFPDDTQVVSFIDAYDLGFRYVLIGTRTMQENISYELCFVNELPNPVQELVCFGEGLSRLESISFAHSPLHASTLESSEEAGLIVLDALWTEIGSVSVPARIVERSFGQPFLLIEFWNTRLEVDPSVFEIPEVCDGVPVTPASSALDLREVFGEGTWENLRQLPQFRRLASDAEERLGDSADR